MRPDTLSTESYEHGTRARYITGCRCLPCRAANSRYSTSRELARFYGDRRGLVSAKRVRTHIEKLSALGVGYKQIAKAAGMGATTIWLYKTGARTKIRAHHAKRIFAVKARDVAAGSRVPIGPTLARVQWLRGEGFSNAEIARRMGLKTPALQFLRRATITRRVADQIAQLYEQFYRLAA